MRCHPSQRHNQTDRATTRQTPVTSALAPMSRRLLSIAVFAVAATGAFAEEKVESGTVIVVKSGAKVQIAEEDPRDVETASVLTYSRRNGPWLWVDSLWGWVDESSVKPLDEAETYYTELIDAAKEAGRKPGVELHRRGIVRLSLGKVDEALADFDAALEAGFKVANVHSNRGRALLEKGDFDAAMEAMTEAIAVNPMSAVAYNARASALSRKEFYEAALTDAEKAVELDGKNANYWYDRGQMQRSLGKFEPAVKSFNEAIRLAPRFVQALVNRGFSLKRLGREKQAASDYRQAIEIDPTLSVARNDLAWLLATTKDTKLRDAKTAVKMAEAAVAAAEEEDSEYADQLGQFLDTLAAAYAAAGEWEKAEAAGRRAVEALDGADQFAADQRLTQYLNKKPYVAD